MKERMRTEIIEKYIAKHKLSKSGFCKVCGISPSTLKTILSQSYRFKTNALFKIVKVLGIKPYQFFEVMD